MSLPAFASPQHYSNAALHQSAPGNLMHTSMMGIDMSMASSNNLYVSITYSHSDDESNIWQSSSTTA
jgi:hypothetical protein